MRKTYIIEYDISFERHEYLEVLEWSGPYLKKVWSLYGQEAKDLCDKLSNKQNKKEIKK